MAGKLVIGRMTVPWAAKHVDCADTTEPKAATTPAAKAAIIEVTILNESDSATPLLQNEPDRRVEARGKHHVVHSDAGPLWGQSCRQVPIRPRCGEARPVTRAFPRPWAFPGCAPEFRGQPIHNLVIAARRGRYRG